VRLRALLVFSAVAFSTASPQGNRLATSLEQRAPGCYEIRDAKGRGPATFSGFFSGIVALDTTPSAKYQAWFRREPPARELRTLAAIPDSAAIDTLLQVSIWRLRGTDTLELSRVHGHGGLTLLLTEGAAGLSGYYVVGGDVIDLDRPLHRYAVTARRVGCPVRAAAP
jgi:hypothetical protein